MADEGYVAFRIERVYDTQRLTDTPPWHAEGGDWTFFDAALAGTPPLFVYCRREG
jgi:hypothetical protein